MFFFRLRISRFPRIPRRSCSLSVSFGLFSSRISRKFSRNSVLRQSVSHESNYSFLDQAIPATPLAVWHVSRFNSRFFPFLWCIFLLSSLYNSAHLIKWFSITTNLEWSEIPESFRDIYINFQKCQKSFQRQWNHCQSECSSRRWGI